MEVILAGHNIDYEIIREIAAAHPERQDLTPETVAAAYARISRNPRPVNELRTLARGEVEKARASNRNIVFEMGHSSIAEHAVFNLDFLAVSRLLVEEIEKFRLASYTEKSQRYVLLTDDFVIPAEVYRAGLEEAFVETVRLQNRCYHGLYEKLRPFIFEKNPELAADPANRSLLEGWAKEDARYVIALATETQLGMTVNARNVELMIRRLAASPLAEAEECSRQLYAATQGVAPSLVRYTEPTAYDRETGEALRTQAAGIIGRTSSPPREEPVAAVRLLDATPEGDEKIVAALLHGASHLPLTGCREVAARMDHREREALIKTALRHMKAYDAAPREFEHAGFTFELSISATCFAQMKRHRMATITVQEYDPGLGVTVPPAVAAIGMEKTFREICARTEETWEKIRQAAPAAAAYILTNAHRRRVAVTLSARELYHLGRVRADRHAQWDIRETASQMVAAGREVMPLTLMLAAGKDGFDALRAEVFATNAEDKGPRKRYARPRPGKEDTQERLMDKGPLTDSQEKSYPPVTGIGRDEHVGMVREIFTTIPRHYDFLNHLLSLRRDIAWRRFAVRKMRFFDTFRFLDVATGTADLAIEAARRHPDIRVAGADFVREMLAPGRQKIAERGLTDRIHLLQADAMALPFPDGSFDAVGIAFGIRNMPDRLGALREMRRVLVPGGRIFVLEMNAPRNRLWRGFFVPYLNRILPVIARRFSRNPAAYLYLVDSITHFPAPPAFLALMEEAGFGDLKRYSLTFGITCLYIGRNNEHDVQASS